MYTDIVNPYPPAFIYFLSLFAKMFGYSPLPYKILTMAAITLIDLSIFYVVLKITKNLKQAIFPIIFFSLVSIPFGVNGLWFDLVQTPLILFSLYFFYKFLIDPKQKNLLLFSSTLITAAFFIKQQTLWIIAFQALYFILHFKNKALDQFTKNYKVLVPPALVLTVHVGFMFQQSLLKDFLFWTIYFPFFKASSVSGYILLPTVKQAAIVVALFAAFVPLFISRKINERFFIFASLVLLFFAYPRFDYFHLIPALAVLSVAVPANITVFKNSKLPMSMAIGALILLLVLTARYISRNVTQEVRFFEKDVYQSSQTLNDQTTKSDLVYMQNAPDQLLPLADRLPPKPWIDDFPWYLEIGNEQDKLLDGIISQNPKYVVFETYKNGNQNDLGVYRPQRVVKYLDMNYQTKTILNNDLILKIKK
ncbi:MAG TPA: hypothetical protein VLE91_00750 [Candidatus Saccharimonadales bacterium]|nr:hypothetical protein [Candidatus Saccharimonadales bacterium]